MAYLSTPDDLALHGVRVMGFATAARVAGRFGLDTDADGHGAFRPLNRRFGEACTDWQMRPTGSDPMAVNDHTDWRWDERVLRTLESCDDALRHLCDRLSRCLVRYDGYADLYSSARRKVDAGERAWLDASDRDWCHMVWMQFHEDLLATLGLDRGTDNLA